MSWYPDDNTSNTFRPTSVESPFYPDDSRPSMPRPVVATMPITASSTLGRMPLTPTYAAPLEAEVVSRADFFHVMLRTALGANYLAPLTMPSYILDVGCGSGRWVRELAGEFPGARIVGLDMATPTESNPATSGVFATVAQPPRTFAFVQHNAMEPLAFASASFDLTHMRQMMGALPVAAWPRVVGEMVRVTVYGGWVELAERGIVRNGGPALETIQRWVLQVMAPQGIDPRISAQLADLLRKLALSDVRTRAIELPVGPHGGRFGELMGVDLMARIESMRGQIIAARVATPDEFAHVQTALHQEMSRSAYTQPVYVVCGRR
jgi:ubiquinone/menaquinone biosynthesis C-methylase UbiE